MATMAADTGETRFARSGNYHIAYQVLGSGPFDLIFAPGWVSHVELALEDPLQGRFLRRLASFSRLILFDKRGTGLSDRVPADKLPTLEERMDDLRAVMDAAGSVRAAIFGVSEGGNLSALFAATYPERTISLAMFGVFAKRLRSEDYPWAPTAEERDRACDQLAETWGSTMDLSSLAPSMAGDAAFMRRLATYLRRSASPGSAVALLRMNTHIDIRAVLPSIRVPTLVLHRLGDRDANVEEGRWIAAQVPGARFTALAGDDHLPWAVTRTRSWTRSRSSSPVRGRHRSGIARWRPSCSPISATPRAMPPAWATTRGVSSSTSITPWFANSWCASVAER